MLIVTGSVENGKKGMTPAVSETSVATCAHWPIKMPSAQGRLRAWNVVRCQPALDVLGEGIMRTPGLMVGPHFAASVTELSMLYAFVVIDGPSLQDAGDCRALDAMLGATIFVHTRKRASELSRAATLFAKKRFSWTVACE